MIWILGFAAIVGISAALLALCVRYDTSDDPYYGRIDDELDRRDGIRREGGAKILEFRRPI